MAKKIKPTTIAILRSNSFGSCKGCGYLLGSRSPRGELFLQVEGGSSNYPRSYHFGCWAKALKDYEAALDRQNGTTNHTK